MKKTTFLGYVRRICLSKATIIMRNCLILLMITALQVLAYDSYSQKARVSLNLQDGTVQEALDEIELQSEFYFLFNKDLVNVNRRININVESQPINATLDRVFHESDVGYVVVDRQIVLSPREYLADLSGKLQPTSVTGKVTDSEGLPLPGLTVTVKGTTQGAVTDMEGNYSIEVEDPEAVLVFTFVGYITQEIAVGNQTRIELVMERDVIGIGEVIAIGYGTQRKVSVTGSVVTTGGDDIVRSQTPDVLNSMVGQLPGVIINSRSGEPGREDPSIYIRGLGTTGDTDPLVVIDGIPRDGLNGLNPSDIENISVLKDASAAIYGARAANGVILVTTKRGNQGRPSFDFSFNQGFSQPTRNPIMADSYTWASVYNEIEENEGRAAYYSAEEMQKFKAGTEDGYGTTDWYETMTKTAVQHRLNLSASGGTEALDYFLSVGEMKQEGHFNHGSTEIQRINVRSNVGVKVTDWLKVDLSLSGRQDNNHYPGNPDTRGIYSHLYLYHPYWNLFWPGTEYKQPLRDNENIINWVSDDGGWQDQNFKSLQSNLDFKLTIPWVEGLSARAGLFYDVGYNFIKTWDLPSYVYYDNGDGTYTEGRSGSGGDLAALEEEFNQNSQFIVNAQLNYDRSFGGHSIQAMAGLEQMKYDFNYMTAGRTDYLSTALPELFAGSSEKDKQSNDGSAEITSRMNYFGRISYNYLHKYMLQLIARYDGSPNFPEEKRWGFFPGVSAGWRISEEAFMDNADFITNMKLRASYGEMGNDAVSAFQYLTSYAYDNNYVLGGTDVIGLMQSGVPNPNITWEVSKTTNVGLDASILNGLLSLEFDYFSSKRSNILMKRTVVIPDYTGLELPDENIGKVNNHGFELQLRHANDMGKLRYNAFGSVSFARNEVVYADEAPAAEDYQMATGMPIGSELYYQAVGIYRDQADVDSWPTLEGARPGDIKFSDENNDGQINSLDAVRMPLTDVPEIVYSLGLNLEWSGLDFSVLFQGQENAQAYMGRRDEGGYFPIMSYALGNFTQWRADDRWSLSNTDGTQPRGSVETRNNNSNMESTQWLFDAAFLRLKNLELGYTLPASLTGRAGIEKLRLYVSGYNLLILFDSMKDIGFDPEANDYWFYPQQRVFNLGVNLTF